MSSDLMKDDHTQHYNNVALCCITYMHNIHVCVHTDESSSNEDEDIFPTREEVQRRCLRVEREEYLKVLCHSNCWCLMTILQINHVFRNNVTKKTHISSVRKTKECWQLSLKEQHRVRVHAHLVCCCIYDNGLPLNRAQNEEGLLALEEERLGESGRVIEKGYFII